jgi:hypothetical protein
VTSAGLVVVAPSKWISAKMLEVIEYLRDLAQTCTRLARACPHLATAHGLEEVAHDLMAKAKELEDLQPN